MPTSESAAVSGGEYSHPVQPTVSNWPTNLGDRGSVVAVTELPPVVGQIVALARQHIMPEVVYLFGSRATGTFATTSDIDLAFLPRRPAAWGAFATAAREQARTLLELDLVNLAECQPELRAQIERGGVVIDAAAG